MSADLPTRAVAFAREQLKAVADPVIAPQMAAYMKTDQPCYGVKRPQRKPVERALRADFAPADRDEYTACVLALWGQPEREWRYLAQRYARAFGRYIDRASMPLYERLIREGAWWDLVDENAAHLVGQVWLTDRAWTGRLMDRWIDDDHLWIRRTAIIGQLRHQEQTDADRLFRYCRARMHEKEFFIRKAIGWALRSYGYCNPDAVVAFLERHRGGLSGLSFREGSRRLVAEGRMEK